MRYKYLAVENYTLEELRDRIAEFDAYTQTLWDRLGPPSSPMTFERWNQQMSDWEILDEEGEKIARIRPKMYVATTPQPVGCNHCGAEGTRMWVCDELTLCDSCYGDWGK